MNEKPLIVISAERFFQGGSVVIVNECLRYLSQNLTSRYRIKALIFKRNLYDDLPGIEYIEFRRSRKSIINRLYYEYFSFKKLSRKWKPFLWLSLQDSTPNVECEIQAVYFQNALLLKPHSLKLWKYQLHLWLLWFLYKMVYIRGITKNKFVIVQQETISEFLKNRYRVTEDQILIFPPKLQALNVGAASVVRNNEYTFIFPATAFSYKNYDVVFKACQLLQGTSPAFKILLTIDGDENRYIRALKRKYNGTNIKFLDVQKRKDLFALYNMADCMLFPSLLESWGLPLTEFRQQDKPILCADLPYAKETLGNYAKVKFFNPYNAEMLAIYMLQAIEKKLQFDKNEFYHSRSIIENWQKLFDILLDKPYHVKPE